MKELNTELPDDADVHWCSNGHCAWLEDEAGNMYRPPKWVYRLVGEAKAEGRNEVRRRIAEELKLEREPSI